jgi:hypothetical protein
VGHVKNNSDLETPKGQEGVGRVLNGLFSYGTEALDRIAFQKALDDIAASESAGTVSGCTISRNPLGKLVAVGCVVRGGIATRITAWAAHADNATGPFGLPARDFVPPKAERAAATSLCLAT